MGSETVRVLPSVTLTFESGSLKGQSIALATAVTTLGREADCDIRFEEDADRSVSRRHARLLITADGVAIEDCGSSNGTLVNGERITRSQLRRGDRVQFGAAGPVAVIEGDGVPAGGVRQSPSGGDSPSVRIERAVSQMQSRFTRRLAGAVVVLAVAVGGGAWWTLRNVDPDTVMAPIEARYRGSVVLIEVGYSVRGRYVARSEGSGFVVDANGHVVTNKHVAAPEYYNRNTACVYAYYRAVEPTFRTVVTLWFGGTRFRKSPDADSDRGLGYSTENKNLAVVGLAQSDSPVRITCELEGLRPFDIDWTRSTDVNNDLAVLKVSTSDPLPSPLQLAPREPSAGTPVMVLGFPYGSTPLETTDAVPLRRVGRVLRVQETVQIDAVVMFGNSGGPLIDRHGQVVGVTTQGVGETLNSAVKAEYVRRLLDRVKSTQK